MFVSCPTFCNINKVFLYISYLFVTESQDHRRVDLGRHLQKSFGPSLCCSRQGHLKDVPLAFVQSGFENIQEWRSHNLSEKPVLLFYNPQSIRNFFTLKLNFPHFSCSISTFSSQQITNIKKFFFFVISSCKLIFETDRSKWLKV